MIALLYPCHSWADPYQSCDQERASPQQSVNSVYLEFVNHSSFDAKIFWDDFNGNRVLYRILHAGESYSQQTYEGHVWVITRPNGVCNFVYTADASGETVDIY